MGTAILVGGLVLLLGAGGIGLVAWRGRLVSPSLARMVKQHGLRWLFSPRGLHFYVYARWPRYYIRFVLRHVLKRVKPGVKGRAADHYHAKVLKTDQARSLLTIERPIPLCDLDQVVPYRMARRLLLDSPVDVVLLDCPCRLARPEPCYPLRVCMVVGRPFTDFVLDHHAGRCQRVTPAAAVRVLQAEHRRGHIHTAWFKDVCFDRFFAICNCCKCCCGGLEAMVRYGIPTMVSSGYTATIDPQRCTGCGRCQAACPFAAICMDNKIARVDTTACMGCGVCESRCREQAITLERDPNKGPPLDVQRLQELVRPGQF